MGKTLIEWSDLSWNPIAGCSIDSPGCINCYAQKLAGTRLSKIPLYEGTTIPTKNGPKFNGVLKILPDDHPAWTWPIRAKGPRARRRGPDSRPMLFVGDMSDLFHEDRPEEHIDRVFAVMALAEHIDFQVLTKRPHIARRYLESNSAPGRIWANIGRLAYASQLPDPVAAVARASERLNTLPLSNVWLGTSAEDQTRFDQRWPELAQTKAAVRFLSIEPQIGRIDMCEQLGMWWNQTKDEWILEDGIVRPDWVICGGESGDDIRHFHYSWADSLRRQCAGASIPLFVKQMGAKPINDLDDPSRPTAAGLESSKGGDMTEWPEQLRVRQWPVLREAA